MLIECVIVVWLVVDVFVEWFVVKVCMLVVGDLLVGYLFGMMVDVLVVMCVVLLVEDVCVYGVYLLFGCCVEGVMM